MSRDLEQIRASVATLLAEEERVAYPIGPEQKRLKHIFEELCAYHAALDDDATRRRATSPIDTSESPEKSASSGASPDLATPTKSGSANVASAASAASAWLEMLPVACVLVGDNGEVTAVNQALVDLVEQPASALVSGSLFSQLASSGVETMARQLEASKAEARQVFRCDVQLRAASGRVLDVGAVLTGVQRNDDRASATLVVLQDLSRYRRDERERRRVRRELEVSQIRGAAAFLVGNLAQSMSQVLGNVTRIASLILLSDPARELLTPDLKEILYICEEGRSKLANQTRNTIPTRLERREVNLNDLVPGVVKLVRHVSTPLVRIESTMGTDQLCANIVVPQVVLAVTNLCLNAVESFGVGGNEPTQIIDASEQGAPVISVLVAEVTLDATEAHELGVDAGGYVKIAVQDNGPGMPPDVLHQATDPFFSTKPPESGIGLGLTLTVACARHHRGAFYVESELGQGTTVSLLLPRTKANSSARAGTNAPSPIGSHASSDLAGLPGIPAPLPPSPSQSTLGTAALPNLRDLAALQSRASRRNVNVERVALFVDDEPLMQETGRRLLEKLGFRVDIAADGIEALEIYSADPQRYALIVLDISLPRMSGLEVLERVLESRPEMRVLLITGHASLPIAPSLFAKPNIYLLQKPFSIHEIRGAIERLTSSK